MKRRHVSCALAVLLSACSSTAKPTVGGDLATPPTTPSAPAAAALVPTRLLMFAIYTKAPIAPAAVTRVQALARKQFPDYLSTPEALDGDHAKSALVVDAPALAEFAPPDEQYLASLSEALSPADRAAVASARGVLRFGVRFDDDPKLLRLRAVEKFIVEIAEQVHGFIWDEEVRIVYTTAQWRAVRMDGDGWQGDIPNVRKQSAIHAYHTNGRLRIVTVGLSNLGLPDLVIENAWESTSAQLGTVLSVLAQAMAEGQDVRAPGTFTIDLDKIVHAEQKKAFFATGPGPHQPLLVYLSIGERESGDADNRLWEVRFIDRPSRLDSHPPEAEAQSQAVNKLFGKVDDHIIGAEAGDPELEAITARVQAKLPKLRAAFQKGLTPNEAFLVKAPFKTDGEGQTAGVGVEWMWVAVTAWPGETITGRLDNEPSNVHALKAGATVNVKQSEVADYLWRKPDGKLEGGDSAKLLRAREGR